MDDTVITNPGDIVLIKLGKDKQKSFYIYVIRVTADMYKRGWWNVRFYPLIQTMDFKLHEVEWKLDDQQIRGEEFVIDNHFYQLFKTETINIDPDEYKTNSPAVKPSPGTPASFTPGYTRFAKGYDSGEVKESGTPWSTFINNSNPMKRKLTPKQHPRIKREIPPYLRLVPDIVKE